MDADEALGLLAPDVRARARRAAHPDRVEPQLASLHDAAFDHPEWLFERKLDGMRLLVHRQGDRAALRTRRGENRAPGFPELAAALPDTVPGDVVLDGEVVAFEGATTSFARLQGRIGLNDPRRALATGIEVHLYLFDLLHLDGWDLRDVPLRDRKRLLRAVTTFADPLRFTPHVDERGAAELERACARGWEGLIAKRASAPYTGGRSRRWLKLKCQRAQELVVGGWTPPRGTRSGFGSLLLGHYDAAGLRYAGKVGTGFSARALDELAARLRELERDTPPFVDPPRLAGARWVAPRLVAQIAFGEWTRDGRLRHPRFRGLRPDKDPREVVREEMSGHATGGPGTGAAT